jgi:dihydrofolate reductase
LTVSKLISSTYITLDGVIENPQDWPSLGSFTDSGNQVQSDLLFSCSAVLMGRHTYEGFVPVWPAMAGNPFADRINEMPKYVVSTTLKDPTWTNTTVIDHDVVGEVARLKEESERDIVQWGFGDVTRTLMAAGLLDELHLWIHPFFLGSGGPKDLLYRDVALTTFDLTNVNTLDSGIVILTYARPVADGS